MTLPPELLARVFDELVGHGVTGRCLRRLFRESGHDGRMALSLVANRTMEVIRGFPPSGIPAGRQAVRERTIALAIAGLGRCRNPELLREAFLASGVAPGPVLRCCPASLRGYVSSAMRGGNVSRHG